MKSLTFSALLSTVAVGLVAAPAQASLIGDSIDYSFGLNNGATFLSGSAIVTDSGAEYDDLVIGADVVIDLAADSFDLSLDFPGTASRDLKWVLSDLDWVDKPGEIIGVTQTAGRSAVDISWTADSITVITPADVTAPVSDLYSFDIQTTHAVPEPLTILGAGTAISFGAAFKRKLAKKKADKA
ncbi:MAG: PEP-CTERM sorting domain-containing protein [Crocosphaera sp.]|nr:PEP-CTERM sorting domain-containing protein [Crocosphaera sp.]MCH2244926.1 PEP-CTERM sorting domain-containing protein [Crocosphaera sp.]